MSLIEKIPAILEDILENSDKLDINSKMIKAYKGNLNPLYADAIKSVTVQQHRIDLETHKTHINPYQKVIKKLSQNYSFNVDRKFNVSLGQGVLDFYNKKIGNTPFLEANTYANVTQYSCIKLIFDKKKGILDAVPLSADQFWVYTDDVYNPRTPTVFVEFISDNLTKAQMKAGSVLNKTMYIYTDTERIEVNVTKSRFRDLKWNVMSESTVNPLGFIPFCFLTYDSSQLIPETNTSDVSFAARLPVVYTEIAVALHYLSNPIAVFSGIDQKESQLAIDPSSAIVLNPQAGSTNGPTFQFISPNLDISQGLNFVATLVSDFLYSKDVPVKKEGVVDQSGLSMLIEGADTLEARKSQIPYLDKLEQDFWNKLAKFHNYLLKSEDVMIYKASGLGLCELEDFDVDITYQLPSVAQEQMNGTGEVSQNPNNRFNSFKKNEESIQDTDEKDGE